MSFMSGRDGDKEAVDPHLGRTEVILRRVRGTCLSQPITNAIFDGGPAKASRSAGWLSGRLTCEQWTIAC